MLLSSACLPATTALPIPTETPPPTGTPAPTATVIWFPPTATPTPFPTHVSSPTPDLRPDLGEIVLRDDFSTGSAWQLEQTASGSVALGKNEITIALKSPEVRMSSVRSEPVLSSFYAEITASPTLCKGADEYGLLFRVSSQQDFFRFSLSCDGRARVDRVVGGTASSPQPWIEAGAVPPGAPSISRLAIWVKGREMHFFVNDVYLFTVSDPMLPQGTLGIFARSAGENAVTVSFSDLIVRSLKD